MPRVRLVTLLPKFTDFLQYQADLADNSVRGYVGVVENIIGALSVNGAPTVEDFTQDALQVWLTGLYRDGSRATTVRHKKAALRSFGRFLRLRRFISTDPTQDLMIPRVRRRLPRVLTEQQAETLVAAPLGSDDPFKRQRDHALLWVLYEGGLRAGEVAALDLDRIQFEEPRPGMMQLRVLGKGSKERMVALRRACAPLKEYLAVRAKHPAAASSRSLFLKLEIAPGAPGAMSMTSVSQVVRRYTASLGLSASAHTLRHSCATALVSNGASVPAVKEFLGHADIKTTMMYVQLTTSFIIENALLYHPCNADLRPDKPEGFQLLAELVNQALDERMKKDPALAQMVAQLAAARAGS